MKEKLTAWGALGSAFLASVCCIGPFILVALGLSGVGLAAGIAQYRPLFLVLTFALLGMAFYLIYRKREVRCADESCEIRSGSRGTKVLLWGITVAALGLASSHLWIRVFASKAPLAAQGERITLQVTGMHCEACAVTGGRGCEVVGYFNRLMFWMAVAIYGTGFFFAYLLAPILRFIG